MTISQATQALLAHIDSDPIYTKADELFALLTRLLAAHAPSNGCHLPGAVGGMIRRLADEWGLALSKDPRIQATGNLALEIGADQPEIDLVVTAHMDRPSFRVLSLEHGTLYPLCAIRIPHDNYICQAKAVRYQHGAMKVAAAGEMRVRESGAGHRISFRAERGALDWGDTILMEATPQRQGSHIVGAGLDNAAGVLLALLAGRILKGFAADIARRGQKILFVFTDQEEGPPVGLFGQGAARLSHAIPPPRLGFINIDAHNVDQVAPGAGASHAFVSGRGRGSVVPLAYQALAASLARAINQGRPDTVRLNYGYVSRSDDMLLSLWSRCLALIGVPLAHAHTTEERVAPGDMTSALYWITAFISHILEGDAQHKGENL